MNPSRALSAIPLPVRRALRTLGADLASARKRRRIPMALMAERAMTTRQTIARIEHGDPSVSLGLIATVLFVLGLTERLSALAAAASDLVGLGLDEERLPKRVRASSASRRSPAP